MDLRLLNKNNSTSLEAGNKTKSIIKNYCYLQENERTEEVKEWVCKTNRQIFKIHMYYRKNQKKHDFVLLFMITGSSWKVQVTICARQGQLHNGVT